MYLSDLRTPFLCDTVLTSFRLNDYAVSDLLTISMLVLTSTVPPSCLTAPRVYCRSVLNNLSCHNNALTQRFAVPSDWNQLMCTPTGDNDSHPPVVGWSAKKGTRNQRKSFVETRKLGGGARSAGSASTEAAERKDVWGLPL